MFLLNSKYLFQFYTRNIPNDVYVDTRETEHIINALEKCQNVFVQTKLEVLQVGIRFLFRLKSWILSFKKFLK